MPVIFRIDAARRRRYHRVDENGRDRDGSAAFVMVKHVEVAIIGAGSAGLAALREVRKRTDDFVVFDDGPLGTMCARTGCMPSKALIRLAGDYHRARRLGALGIGGGSRLRLSVPEALAWVRALRDGFSEEPARAARRLGRRLVRSRAVFVGPRRLRAGEDEYVFKRVILATGSRPVLPDSFRACGDRVVTTDSLFELRDLPRRIGVVGLGSIGLELGQALSRLGCDVVAFDRSRGVGSLTDPALNAYAARRFANEFPIHFDCDAALRRRGRAIEVRAGGRAYVRDLILACIGRRPNLDGLGLEEIGVRLDGRGAPDFDVRTMKAAGHPIFLAGDAGGRRAILHEALDEGRIAGRNSVGRSPRRFGRRAPLSIAFCEPNVALVGRGWAELERGTFTTGEASLETQSRALIMGENAGLLHVYARVGDGELLGAELIAPAGEHLAHLLAWALQRKLTVFEMLELPFYHPTIEEGLRTALEDAARKLRRRRARPGARE